MTYMWDCHEPH